MGHLAMVYLVNHPVDCDMDSLCRMIVLEMSCGCCVVHLNSWFVALHLSKVLVARYPVGAVAISRYWKVLEDCCVGSCWSRCVRVEAVMDIARQH